MKPFQDHGRTMRRISGKGCCGRPLRVIGLRLRKLTGLRCLFPVYAAEELRVFGLFGNRADFKFGSEELNCQSPNTFRAGQWTFEIAGYAFGDFVGRSNSHPETAKFVLGHTKTV